MVYDINEIAGRVNRAILHLPLPAEPAGLYDPVRYALEGGGKRLRPVLAIICCHAAGGTDGDVINQALGIEMFHNFTLLHDDVMDRADVRRGRPTVHRRWNESTAILSGDAMLTLAGELVAKAPDHLLRQALELFNRTAMDVYEGQQYDMDFEHRDDVTPEEYIDMIRLKTSVLLGGACAMGALMGGADHRMRNCLYDYGVRLGLAFQLQDDLLDTYGDPIVFGKEIGGDIRNDKKTWLLITAIKEAPDQIRAIRERHLSSDDKIDSVRAVYDSLDLRRRCDELVKKYSQEAIATLDGLSMPSGPREALVKLARDCARRNH